MIFSGLNGHTMTFFSPCFQQLIYRQKYLSYFLNTVFIHNWLLCAEKGCFIFIYPEGNENNQREDNENNSEEGVRWSKKNVYSPGWFMWQGSLTHKSCFLLHTHMTAASACLIPGEHRACINSLGKDSLKTFLAKLLWPGNNVTAHACTLNDGGFSMARNCSTSHPSCSSPGMKMLGEEEEEKCGSVKIALFPFVRNTRGEDGWRAEEAGGLFQRNVSSM